MKYLLLSFLIMTACKSKNYIITTDIHDRPITGCLRASEDAFVGATIAMNCQKSIIETKLLCSQGRMLHYFTTSEQCEKQRSYFKDLNGEYLLKEDPYNNPTFPDFK